MAQYSGLVITNKATLSVPDEYAKEFPEWYKQNGRKIIVMQSPSYCVLGHLVCNPEILLDYIWNTQMAPIPSVFLKNLEDS